jgi:hypothetical protein
LIEADLSAIRKNTMGNFRRSDAEPNDYYATEPRAVELLLEQERFSELIWEPACGEGHISKVLEEHGHSVISTDLIDRGYGLGGRDFLKENGAFRGDIITNPPFKQAKEFVEKALDVVEPGNKVAMFLKLNFLESRSRQELFKNRPPQAVYVSPSRLECGKNGVFGRNSTVAYAWFVWRKGYPRPNIPKVA